jgi:hypothetical protein
VLAKSLQMQTADGLRISGILQIDPCYFVGADRYEAHSHDGPSGLYGFLLHIESLTFDMLLSKPLFARYIE